MEERSQLSLHVFKKRQRRRLVGYGPKLGSDKKMTKWTWTDVVLVAVVVIWLMTVAFPWLGPKWRSNLLLSSVRPPFPWRSRVP